MVARGRQELEMRAAPALGDKVCQQVEIGGGQRDWVRGVVEAMQATYIGVRIEDAGTFKQARAGERLAALLLNSVRILIFALGIATLAPNSWAQCRVLDPELQEAYAGPCVD